MRFNLLTTSFSLLLAVAVIAMTSGNAIAVPISSSQGTFTGSGSGEGLDLEGDFVYAVNMIGPGGGAIGDAVFTNDGVAGVSYFASHNAPNWKTPDFDGGGAANSGVGAEGALETVMRSIRWNHTARNGQDLEVNLNMNIDMGQEYKLQLFFYEPSDTSPRMFDVSVDGNLVVDNFDARNTSTNVARVITHIFEADSMMVAISLDGTGPGSGDRNPILNGFTLERLTADVPEPATFALASLGLVSLGLRRRRANR